MKPYKNFRQTIIHIFGLLYIFLALFSYENNTSKNKSTVDKTYWKQASNSVMTSKYTFHLSLIMFHTKFFQKRKVSYESHSIVSQHQIHQEWTYMCLISQYLSQIHWITPQSSRKKICHILVKTPCHCPLFSICHMTNILHLACLSKRPLFLAYFYLLFGKEVYL